MSCELTLKELAVAVDGEIISAVNSKFSGVVTDTRASLEGHLFVALRGESFDAHDFLNKKLNPAILLVDRITSDILQMADRVSIVIVEDTLIGLQNLAHYWREKLNTPIFAITGSNGKTTSKEFTAQILSDLMPVHYSKGSFNNHWGVPFSLLGLAKTHKSAIIEMGMNHEGELKALCKIARPNVTVVTMVGSSHIGYFKDQSHVAKAKEEIYRYSPESIKIFNLDNAHTLKMYKHYRPHSACLTFSSEKTEADVFLKVVSSGLTYLEVEGYIRGGSGAAKVNVFGEHNIVNLMVACCGALALKVPAKEIWKQIEKCKTSWGRNQLFTYDGQVDVLFDAYNANPESMAALLSNTKKISVVGKKIAILGEMGELGEFSQQFHEKLAHQVKESSFDLVWFVGPSQQQFGKCLVSEGFKNSLLLSDTYNELLDKQVQNMLNPGDVVLIKGSRFNRLEKILDSWAPHLESK
ncbi:MAG: UDP-N-acetylmuramoyl-tripeptide--D-alanyl-D-alanine ligase [Bdellovibrionales bacterium]|nr:UDP-N-acetylmuramoyl-tripeptide--D-alanyl-D-alanine ligase [Bdellovibrionales bacterium]